MKLSKMVMFCFLTFGICGMARADKYISDDGGISKANHVELFKSGVLVQDPVKKQNFMAYIVCVDGVKKTTCTVQSNPPPYLACHFKSQGKSEAMKNPAKSVSLKVSKSVLDIHAFQPKVNVGFVSCEGSKCHLQRTPPEFSACRPVSEEKIEMDKAPGNQRQPEQFQMPASWSDGTT